MRKTYLLVTLGLAAAALPARAATVASTTHAHGSLAVPGAVLQSILNDDLLQEAGVVKSESNAATGWHGAASDKFSQVNDGLPPDNGLDGLVNDFETQPVNTFTYQLAGTRDIGAINVIGGNFGGDGRIFLTVVVEASTNNGGTYFGIGGANGTGYYQSDPSGVVNVNGNPGNISGDPNNPYEETLLSIFNDASPILVAGATNLRVSIFSADNTGGQNRDPYDGVNPYTGIDDGLTAGFVSTLLWEIDAVQAVPEPSSIALGALGAVGCAWAVARRKR